MYFLAIHHGKNCEIVPILDLIQFLGAKSPREIASHINIGGKKNVIRMFQGCFIGVSRAFKGYAYSLFVNNLRNYNLKLEFQIKI